MTLTRYPPATPEAMTLLARLLAERGVELRVTTGGELRFRDRDNRLSPADRQVLHHYRHALADRLVTPEDDPVEPAPERAVDPDAPRCGRCGSAEFAEVPVHAGASIRRDCARCGRTWGFPVWRGAG